MSKSVVARIAVPVRRGVLVALGFVQVFGIVGCGKFADSTPAEVQVTQTCGRFSFVVTGKSDASKARSAFYAANIRFRGVDFVDDRFSGSSKFILGGQIFVLGGLGSYLDNVGDSPLTLEIRAISTVVNTPSRQSVPCTSPNAAIDFDNIKAAFSEIWEVHAELESPEYGHQSAAAK